MGPTFGDKGSGVGHGTVERVRVRRCEKPGGPSQRMMETVENNAMSTLSIILMLQWDKLTTSHVY